jgi:hypothetical protein
MKSAFIMNIHSFAGIFPFACILFKESGTLEYYEKHLNLAEEIQDYNKIAMRRKKKRT